MTATLKSVIQRVRYSSRTQAYGLTIIGVGMLISAGLAEHVEHAVLREGAQIAVIAVGVLGTAVLFCPSRKIGIRIGGGKMLSEFLALRAGFPSAFGAIRWVAAVLLCMLLFIVGIGFVVELGSSPEQHERHGHTGRRVGR